MAIAWVFIADGEVPAESREAWLGLGADPAVECSELDPAVRAAFALHLDADSAPNTVAEVLAGLGEEEGARVSFDGRLAVRLVATNGQAWWRWRSGTVAAIAALGRVGGRGRLEIVGSVESGPDTGFRLDVNPAGRRLTRLDAGAVARVHESDGYREAAARAPVQEPSPPRPPAPPYEHIHQSMNAVARMIATRALCDPRDGLKRVQRRILWAMHPDGSEGLTSDEIVGRIQRRHPERWAFAEALAAMARPRAPRVALVEEKGQRYFLSPLAVESLTALAAAEPSALTDSSDGHALSLPVPWLFAGGPSGIVAGMHCDIPPAIPAELRQAVEARLANPPRVPIRLCHARTAVLVDETPVELDTSALLDAYLAHRCETLSRRGVRDPKRQIVSELDRWLGV